MPNVIKSSNVLITDQNVKVIDSNPKDDFMPMQFKTAVEIDTPKDEDDNTNEEELFQINHTQNASDKLHEMQAYAEKIIEDARIEADEIKETALLNVQREIDEMRALAEEDGFRFGVEKAQDEILSEKNKLKEKELQLEEIYNEKMLQMESQVTELLIALVKKITGVVIEEKSIIRFLVCDAVKGQSGCNEFRISVSKADYGEVNDHVNEISDLLKSTAQITIVENPELSKNQCKIETEKNIIDCSLETKLDNLLMSLKLLT